MDVLTLFFKTIALRPYVFVFLSAFLFAGTVTIGWRRTLLFWLGTWFIAFLSEYSSTRNGFPYGFYHYTGLTRGQELYISNVPFMDSLSYSFLLFASYSMALFSLTPPIRKSWKVLLLTSLYMMMIDAVIDPVALRGDRWFLGRIYYYDYSGYYFGVPLSNALGWGLVGWVATFVFQRLENKFSRGRTFQIPGSDFFGVGLYYGVLAFNLAVTAWIGEWGLFIAGCFIYLIPTVLLFTLRC